MKNEEFINDAVEVAQSLLKVFPPNSEWIVVNLAKDTQKEAVKPLLSNIGSVLYYHFDNVPGFLKEQGVFLAFTEGKWFVKVKQFRPLEEEYKVHQMYDKISSIARIKGYFAKGQKVVYFDNRTNFVHPLNGQFAVLVIKQKLEEFISRFSPEDTEKGSIKVQLPKQAKIAAMFDEIKGVIKLGSVEVPIRTNTNQYYLCKIILKSDSSKKKAWEWDEIIEKIGDVNTIELKDELGKQKIDMRVYSAAREVNQKVARKIQTEDFFITTTKTVKLNPQFV